jgi:uncharacterized membrane protein YgaE (UPF0421/DUF939 family)
MFDLRWLRMVHSRLSGIAEVVHRRLRRGARPVTQAAIAAGVAWYIAHDLLGHLQPFFAPVAAVVSLGASGIMRGQRALQLITGVALGIVIGSGVQAVAGVGPVALGVAVFVSMCLAAVIGRDFVGAGAMFINQTASSAVLVIALHRTGTGSERLIDALIGGGVALTMAVLLFPAAPLPLIRDATQDVFAAFGEALDHLGEVLAGQTRPDAAWTISISQRIHGRLATLTDAHTTGVRIVGLAPRRRRDRMAVRRAEAHWGELNLLAGTVLSLLRVATAAVRADVAVPSRLQGAIGDLAAALNVLAGPGPADVSDSIAAANHTAELIDNRPLSPEGYLAFIGSLTRLGAADLSRAVDLGPTTDK